MLGCELWTENFDSMLALVKEYITSGGSRGGGGGGKGGNGTPLSEKKLACLLLTINNPALAILLSSSRLEDIRGLHSGACDSSNNATTKD